VEPQQAASAVFGAPSGKHAALDQAHHNMPEPVTQCSVTSGCWPLLLLLLQAHLLYTRRSSDDGAHMRVLQAPADT
jgi:hypothetical protein